MKSLQPLHRNKREVKKLVNEIYQNYLEYCIDPKKDKEPNFILEPDVINVVFHRLNKKNKKVPKANNREKIGKYVSKLIQNSYDAGANQFTIKNKKLSAHYLGYKLHGEKDNLLEITIDQGYANNIGGDARYCHFNITASGPSLGSVIHKYRCGWFAENCVFIVDDFDLHTQIRNRDYPMFSCVVYVRGPKGEWESRYQTTDETKAEMWFEWRKRFSPNK